MSPSTWRFCRKLPPVGFSKEVSGGGPRASGALTEALPPLSVYTQYITAATSSNNLPSSRDHRRGCTSKPEISEKLHTVLTPSTHPTALPCLAQGPGMSAGRDLQTTWKTNYPKLAGSRQRQSGGCMARGGGFGEEEVEEKTERVDGG